MVNKSYGFSGGDRKKVVVRTVIYILILALFVFFCLRIFTYEDNWIKDSKGLWIKHGNPTSLPENVLKQQEAISCASGLYADKSMMGMNFSSQCLGACGDYSIDIVHVPRINEDDLLENQCGEFNNGETKYFIELNSHGQIVKVVD